MLQKKLVSLEGSQLIICGVGQEGREQQRSQGNFSLTQELNSLHSGARDLITLACVTTNVINSHKIILLF